MIALSLVTLAAPLVCIGFLRRYARFAESLRMEHVVRYSPVDGIVLSGEPASMRGVRRLRITWSVLLAVSLGAVAFLLSSDLQGWAGDKLNRLERWQDERLWQRSPCSRLPPPAEVLRWAVLTGATAAQEPWERHRATNTFCTQALVLSLKGIPPPISELELQVVVPPDHFVNELPEDAVVQKREQVCGAEVRARLVNGGDALELSKDQQLVHVTRAADELARFLQRSCPVRFDR